MSMFFFIWTSMGNLSSKDTVLAINPSKPDPNLRLVEAREP